MAFSKEICVANMNDVCNAWKLNKHTTVGLSAVYDKWAEAKAPLLDLLRCHPNWNEDAQAVIVSTETERPRDIDKYYHLMSECLNRLDEKRYRMSEQKKRFFLTCRDYFPEESTLSNTDVSNIRDWLNNRIMRSVGGEYDVFCELKKYIATGQKFSRFLNKMFELYNLRELCGTYTNSQGETKVWFDKWFADLSDTLNPTKVNMVTALSVHPCDYMNMSHGTGWKSCHNMQSGGWRGGCISYMLDGVSMELFTVAEPESSIDFTKLHALEKVNRQMFMVSGGSLLSSRLYPANNDKARREIFRATVEQIISTCYAVPNAWGPDYYVGNSVYKNYISTNPKSRHYKDYEYEQYNTTLNFLNDVEAREIIIGGPVISLSVGVELNADSGDIFGNFAICKECGKLIDLSNSAFHKIGNDYYCTEHAFVCKMCGHTHATSSVTNTYTDSKGNRVCDNCYNENSKPCQFCGATSFVDELLRGRRADGRYSGKYAHKACVPDKYGVCSCGAYQDKANMTTLTNSSGERTVCSTCTSVFTEWLDTVANL